VRVRIRQGVEWGRKEEALAGETAFPERGSLLASTLELAAAGRRIVTALSGTWHRDRGVCCCPAHEDKVASLSVRVGDRSLLFKCFAGCDTASVLAALRARRCDVPRLKERGPADHEIGGEVLALGRLRRLWFEAKPLSGTIGEAYLRDRGICALPSALRFHPLCPVRQGRWLRFRPAVIAAVTGQRGMSALQRIFLAPGGKGLASDIGVPKLSLGRLHDGAVRLSPAGPELGLAEGIETATSATALLGIPVWAALGSSRLHAVGIPPFVKRLVLLPDNDMAGHLAAKKAVQAYSRSDLELDIEWPPDGLNDWNDVLRRHARREGRGGR